MRVRLRRRSRRRRRSKQADRERNADQKYLRSLLQALQAVRGGDFSARLPTDEVGLAGKIADTFNDIVSGEREDGAATRAGRRDGGTGGKDAQTTPARRQRRGMGRDGRFRQCPDRRSPLANDRGYARDHRGRAGRFATNGPPRCGWASAQGRISALGENRERDDQTAQRVHLRGHARRSRSRH